jgi:hypothetical protein
MKKIKENGVYPNKYEIYEDGTGKCTCTKCGKFDDIKEETLEKLIKTTKWHYTYVCYGCWKGTKSDKNLNGIIWGQAYNNAIQCVLADGVKQSDEDFFSLVSTYQKQHYDFIIKNKTNENGND